MGGPPMLDLKSTGGPPLPRKKKTSVTDLLLKLFGIKATDSSRIADTDVSFHGVNPAWVILAALVLGAVVFLMYRRAGEGLSLFRRISLFILRAVFLLLILG